MRLGALFIGLCLVAGGVIGIVVPQTFFVAISWFQVPPTIYVATVIRVGVGLVLVGASRRSRVRILLLVLGILIAVGGILTPFVGEKGARVILDWWTSGGSTLVRMWAITTVVIGAFIVYAVTPARRAA